MLRVLAKGKVKRICGDNTSHQFPTTLSPKHIFCVRLVYSVQIWAETGVSLTLFGLYVYDDQTVNRIILF